MNLEGKRIVVVGGSSGMGLATARDLAAAGAKVTIASRSAEKLERAARAIGNPVERYVLDIRKEDEIVAFFETVKTLDHLVVSASGAVLGPFLEIETRTAQDFFDSKFWGTYRVARHGAPRLAKNGSITFFSGAASQRGTPGLSAGSAINAAIEALGRTLAVELAPIRVNTVAPGLIETPVWEGLMAEQDKKAFFKEAAAKLPARRIGTPEDIAHSVRYLIENTYTTGSVLFPEGGYLQV